MNKQNPEIESINFDDDLIDEPADSIEELLSDVPTPMANYLRAANQMLTDFKSPSNLPPIPFGSLALVNPSFKVQIHDKDQRLDRTDIEESLNNGWRIDAIHRINKQTLIVWVKMENVNAEETGNT